MTSNNPKQTTLKELEELKKQADIYVKSLCSICERPEFRHDSNYCYFVKVVKGIK